MSAESRLKANSLSGIEVGHMGHKERRLGIHSTVGSDGSRSDPKWHIPAHEDYQARQEGRAQKYTRTEQRSVNQRRKGQRRPTCDQHASGADQRPDLKPATTTTSILPRLDRVCTSLAVLAFTLGSLARDRQSAQLARMATDALEICTRVHRLAEDIAEWEAEELA